MRMMTWRAVFTSPYLDRVHRHEQPHGVEAVSLGLVQAPQDALDARLQPLGVPPQVEIGSKT